MKIEHLGEKMVQYNVTAAAGLNSTTKIRFPLGVNVYKVEGATAWSYVTPVLTVVVAHSSSAYITAHFTAVWGDVADLIDGAFSFFGLLNYMTQITAFVSSIVSQFTASLVNLATLINLQFLVIWRVFAWWLGWANRLITAVLNFGTQLSMILNGTHPLLAGTVDLWNYFNFASAGQAVFDIAPLFFIVYWIDSMAKRARTQGSLQVLYGDLSSFANIFAYFMGAFSMVIGFIEGKISWLISALT